MIKASLDAFAGTTETFESYDKHNLSKTISPHVLHKWPLTANKLFVKQAKKISRHF